MGPRALMLLLPIFTVASRRRVRRDRRSTHELRPPNAAAVTFLVASAFFMYHLLVVADAFAERRDAGSLRGGTSCDYLVLGVVCLALAGFYTAAYRGSAPWAGAFAKVFAPSQTLTRRDPWGGRGVARRGMDQGPTA